MKMSLLLVLLMAASSQAQQNDPALFITQPPGINFAGCWSDLVNADVSGDQKVSQSEYLRFVQLYGARKCYSTNALSLDFKSAFNKLACNCRSVPGSSADCCLLDKANIPTAGALNPGRTEEQFSFLTEVCVITDGLIQSSCPQQVITRDTLPPVLIQPVVPNAGGPTQEDIPPGTIWAIIAGIIAALLLLLLICCCCCVVKRRSAKALEEEEIVTNEYANKAAPPDEEAPNGAPRDVPVQPPKDEYEDIPIESEKGDDDEAAEDSDDSGYGRQKTGGAEALEDPEQPEEVEEEEEIVEDSDDDDGVGRTRKGGHEIDDEEDPDGARLRGQGALPPENLADERARLRPVPPKEKEESDEWDYPGRDFSDQKDKLEDSGQEFDPYNPDGGVYDPQRDPKDPLDWNKNWNREKPEDPDETDGRKHRIQSGLGEGEVWNKLNEGEEEPNPNAVDPTGSVFDWVVQSALGVLDSNEAQTTEKKDTKPHG